MRSYQLTKTQLQSELKTNLETGLTEGEAQSRLIKFGPNSLPEKKSESWLVIFFRQFKNPLIYVLFFCAAVIFYLRETSDSIIILAVLLFNALIGAIQEGRSANTLKSLKKLSFAEATLIRGGQEVVVKEEEVVPGDILVLQEGQKVTADARVVLSSNLGVDEAALTGESGSVIKHDTVINEEAVPASGQHNMIFKGTNVLSGSGRAVITSTGMRTEIGKISRALLQPETEIPLQKNIKKLSKFLIYTIGFLTAVLFAFGVWLGRDPKEMFAVVVSLAVSIIPEGLPLVLTLILVTGVWRMSKRNALVKKLQAVEALGEAAILAVDKTGTLTKNEMVVKKIFLADKVFSVTGNGYEPKGAVMWKESPASATSDITTAAIISGLASKATVLFNETEKVYRVAGDPTEAAMTVLSQKLGFLKDDPKDPYKEVAEITFEHKTKYHAVFYEHASHVFCAVAGAPEVLLEKADCYTDNGQCKNINAESKKIFENAIEDFTGQGLRVVAVGYKILEKNNSLDNVDNLTLVGLLGIEDSVRPEAQKAIVKVHSAGLKVVMITGDHKNTAQAIAKEAGIFSHGDLVITGPELDSLSGNDLREKLLRVTVFARVTPDDKMKIIKAYKSAGLIVAMTGDGVNDAPSLVAADLGVAMGKIGTEVAKEAADIILLDDNLGSIVAAIEEGRIMHQNIKKALQFLFSTSLGELVTVVVALVLNLPLPVLAVQILWLNLVTDPLLGAALALEKGEGSASSNQSYKFGKLFVDGPMLAHIATVACVMGAGALYIFNLYHTADEVKARTMTLTLLAIFQWYNAINCRFLFKSIFHKRIFGNIYIWLSLAANLVFQIAAIYSARLNEVLKIVPLTFNEWLVLLALGFIIIFADEARKFIYRMVRSS